MVHIITKINEWVKINNYKYGHTTFDTFISESEIVSKKVNKGKYYYFSTDMYDYRIDILENESDPKYPYFGFKAKEKTLTDFHYDQQIITNDNFYLVMSNVNKIINEYYKENNEYINGFIFSTYSNKKGLQRSKIYKKYLQRDGWKISNTEYPTYFKITKINEWKQLNEDKPIKEFTPLRVQSINTSFNTLPSKYRNNKFFKSIISQLNKNNKLSEKQYDQLSFLLKHGQSMQDAGYPTKKNKK